MASLCCGDCLFFPTPHNLWDLRSLTRDRTHAPCVGGRQILNHWTTREVPKVIYLFRVCFPALELLFPSPFLPWEVCSPCLCLRTLLCALPQGKGWGLPEPTGTVCCPDSPKRLLGDLIQNSGFPCEWEPRGAREVTGRSPRVD